ncbi:hypothetical protein TBLA_0A00670 [Henningerozyma blattae CBS 6284]|uniref:C3H1-type domain-containing protein n=1 Tax=Henningerozyma blattae (strain ATCC 34711 / CBS 6284 / DSM 70876 / NBRC 10599 / NRRL Y-10934 / UCD 77-7) TaxID=1071380 RepID=I2GUR7_HENB6|nr:hypothetical protein TBLA_0A00670 [Tetrapisispora blattae CBS 6284]CCH57869.1 hypothetical protein TBLA_0A00670 [Tetrapisispora blattae CBS 6284]
MDKSNNSWAKSIPCRNVTIYGHCKKQVDGCPFSHEVPNTVVNNEGSTTTTSNSISDTVSGAIAHSDLGSTNISANLPSLPSSALSSTGMNAASSTNSVPASILNTPTSSSTITGTTSSSAMNNSINPTASSTTNNVPRFDARASASFTPMAMSMSASRSSENAVVPGGIPPSLTASLSAASPAATNISVASPAAGASPTPVSLGMTPFEYDYPHPAQNAMGSILQHHLYAPDPPPHLQLALSPHEDTPATLFIPNALREQLLQRNTAAIQTWPSGGALPDVVRDYYGLVPLDFHRNDGLLKNRYFDHKNSLYKVFSNKDGKVYVLRRIHSLDEKNKNINIDIVNLRSIFTKWNKLDNINLIRLNDIFTTTSFGDVSLCSVMEYYPSALSIFEKHFIHFPLVPLTMKYIWGYLVQLVNVLREIHTHGLFAGDDLDWNKIIVTGDPGRIKLNVNISKFILNENLNFKKFTKEEVLKEQNLDFQRLGELCLQLAKKVQPSATNGSTLSALNNQTNSTTSLNLENKSAMNTSTNLNESISSSLHFTNNSNGTKNEGLDDDKKIDGTTIFNEKGEFQNLNISPEIESEIQNLNNVDNQFKLVLRYLFRDSSIKEESQEKRQKKFQEFSNLFYDKIFEYLNVSQKHIEYIENILAKELENARLFRLICKLNCIFGRLESRIDINWSESGEKFPIILFYDYVFHQVNNTGKSVMDLTHVIRCLNKLDAGVKEKIMLVTPDEMNCIIISYKELKNLIDMTFRSMI